MQQAGVYISHHRWLDAHSESVFGVPGRLFKLGMSSDLARRLTDSCYVTAFIGAWSYVYTLETKTVKDAEVLERAVLEFYAAQREAGHELILGPSADELLATALRLAEGFGIAVTPRTKPAYTKVRRAPTQEPATQRAEILTQEHRDIIAQVQDEATMFSVDCIYDDLDGMDAISAIYADEPKRQTARRKAFDIPVQQQTIVLEDRAYQAEAAAACVDELAASERCILQLPCRSGKTKVAHMIMQRYLEDDPAARIAYLVPGLSLLRQTVQKLLSYGDTFGPGDVLLVGSDPVVVPVAGGTLRMTTEKKDVDAFVNVVERPRIVVCMYQSSRLLPDGFALTVFDEAHKITGSEEERPMNLIARRDGTGHRLFMTATPDFTAKGVSMSDRATFGGIAYRYYLRQAIDAGFVNNFRLKIVAAARTDDDPLVRQILAAMEEPGMDKLLVFCRFSTSDAESLCRRVAAAAADLPEERRFTCLVAHSKMSKAEQNRVLEELGAPGTRAALFNCRLFQEGVECAPLNGVFFAAPRHSVRDIVQSVCRCLNRVDDKPDSVVFLPVILDDVKVEAKGEDLNRFADILPVFDALAHEDPRLFDYLMGNVHKCTVECPADCAAAFPVDILGTHSLGLVHRAQKARLLMAVRKATRYTAKGTKRQLIQNKGLPWDFGIGEIRRILTERNRYPITGETVAFHEERINIHSYLKYLVAEFEKFKAGKASDLEPYQIRALEALPAWEPFGRCGPYPPTLCLQYLEEFMDAADGEVPMINLANRECVALNSTKIERLCGFARICNMFDMAAGCRVTKAIADELDRIFGKWGVDWRKKRRADGTIDPGEPSLFQLASKRLDRYYKDFRAGRNDGAYLREHFIHGQYGTL
ncbi:MAG: DEAD/DEAH box helicase family protein [Patescibacteria group bacterium]|nr:DEAD/DEAH box helicase family protein [Patescibacteria group bacterium]